MKVRCPADDVERVHVSESVYVPAYVEKRARSFQVAVSNRPMERAGVVSGFARVRIGTTLQQQPHGIDVSRPRSSVETGPAGVVSGRVGGADKLRVLCNESSQFDDIALC